jgi:hypothetical protein
VAAARLAASIGALAEPVGAAAYGHGVSVVRDPPLVRGVHHAVGLGAQAPPALTGRSPK